MKTHKIITGPNENSQKASNNNDPDWVSYKARSRLYRSQILQVNIRWKALAEIYTMASSEPNHHSNDTDEFVIRQEERTNWQSSE